MFGMRLRHIPVDSDGRVDVKKMERAITSDTCVVGFFFAWSLCSSGGQLEVVKSAFTDI